MSLRDTNAHLKRHYQSSYKQNILITAEYQKITDWIAEFIHLGYIIQTSNGQNFGEKKFVDKVDKVDK